MKLSKSPKGAAFFLAFGLIAAACGSDIASDTAAAVPDAVEEAVDEVVEDEESVDEEEVVEEESEDDALALADPEIPESIVALAQSNPDFSTLVEAVGAAGLGERLSTVDGDTYTILAPNNAAFEAAIEALDTTAEDLLAREDLAAILQFHAIEGSLTVEDIATYDGGTLDTLNGATLNVEVVDGNVTINGANILAQDLETGNGIVQVIDTVLLPPADTAADAETDAAAAADIPESIVALAQSNPDFSTLVEAVGAAGLGERLSTVDGDTYTILAPNNAAFEAAIEALDTTAEDLLAREDLAAILQFHAIEGSLTVEDIATYDGGTLDTLNGATLNVEVVDGNVTINGANILAQDLETGNGIVHVIDSVLLPS